MAVARCQNASKLRDPGGTVMSDDDNYTIDEPDEPSDEESVEQVGERSLRHLIPVAALALGLLTILAAAWCQTSQATFFGEEPDKSSLFVYGLAQPLGIVGALLTVIGICALGVRLHRGGGRERSEGESVDVTDHPVDPATSA